MVQTPKGLDPWFKESWFQRIVVHKFFAWHKHLPRCDWWEINWYSMPGVSRRSQFGFGAASRFGAPENVGRKASSWNKHSRWLQQVSSRISVVSLTCWNNLSSVAPSSASVVRCPVPVPAVYVAPDLSVLHQLVQPHSVCCTSPCRGALFSSSNSVCRSSFCADVRHCRPSMEYRVGVPHQHQWWSAWIPRRQ